MNLSNNKQLGFFANSDDNTHCEQAVLKMIINFYEPNRKLSFDDLDKITEKRPGMYTWPHAGVIWLKSNGYEVKSKEGFDNKAFAEQGVRYLEKEFGDEALKSMLKVSDIDQGIRFAKEVVKMKIDNKGIPTADEVKELVKEGFLVICGVNGRKLNGRKGYTGHSVLLFDVDEDGESFIFHDPGLPPKPNRKMKISKFEEAWAYDGDNHKTYIAVRKEL